MPEPEAQEGAAERHDDSEKCQRAEPERSDRRGKHLQAPGRACLGTVLPDLVP